MSEEIIVESTAWHGFNIEAISNYDEEIKVGDREKKERNQYYTKQLEFKVDYNQMIEIRDLINHYIGECDETECQFCIHSKEQYQTDN
jgi:hypothetical protein